MTTLIMSFIQRYLDGYTYLDRMFIDYICMLVGCWNVFSISYFSRIFECYNRYRPICQFDKIWMNLQQNLNNNTKNIFVLEIISIMSTSNIIIIIIIIVRFIHPFWELISIKSVISYILYILYHEKSINTAVFI